MVSVFMSNLLFWYRCERLLSGRPRLTVWRPNSPQTSIQIGLLMETVTFLQAQIVDLNPLVLGLRIRAEPREPRTFASRF